ncbi:MAG: PAS domain S-box protein [Cyanobacteriota bacterium]|nr:PAS domain S-box protein [Cyanobacteriota bacterium]
MVWLHVSFDASIALAYLSISMLLIYFVRKKTNFGYVGSILLLFGAFLISNSLIHIINIWTIWHPNYWLSAGIKALCAGISIYTAIALVPFVSETLAFRDSEELEAINQKLQQDRSDRQEIENALLKSETRYRCLVEATSQIIWNTDAEGQLLPPQPAWSAFTGQTNEELKGWGWLSAIHPSDRPHTANAWSHAVSSRCFYQVEHRLRRQDGEYRYMSVRGVPVLEPDGSIREWVGVHADITESKEAEKALRQSEERYQTIARVSPVGIFQADAGGNNIYLNERGCEITGLTLEEARGAGWKKAVHPEDRDRVDGEWERSLRENKMLTSEYRLLRPDRTLRWVLCQSVALRDDRSEVTGYLGTLSDITERVEAETQLRQYQENLEELVEKRTAELARANAQLQETEEAARKNEARYRGIVQDQTELICRFKPDGTLTFVNSAYCRYFNKKELELVGKSFMPMIPEEDWAIAEKALANLSLENPVVTVEHRVIMPDGKIRWQQWTDRLVYDRDGQVIETQAVGRDISDRKQAEEELKAYAAKLEISNRELENFANVASHDLQEPLRKIQAFGDRLNSKYGDVLTDKGRDYLGRMQNAAARMQVLIEDLLSFSRVTTKAQPYVPVNLKEVATAVVSDLEVRVEESRAKVEIGNLPTLDADALQMRQLFQNLISNALKFHKKDDPPAVKLEATRQDNMYEIKVIDNGIGFEEKYSDRIFTIFQRLHGRSTYEGTGIGLAVCRKIVERHGGSITARSTPGEGATFIFTLPVRQNSL